MSETGQETVSVELKVGDIAETITVSGASPVVDVQNVTEQSVLNALNTNVVTALNYTYGTTGAAWLQPIAILPARLLKLGVQIAY